MEEDSWQTQLAHLRLPLVIGGVSILLVIVSITLLIKSVQTTTPIQFSSESASQSGVLGQATSQITVDIQGAVARPGVYKLPEGSRVEDAIAATGGLTKEADIERISQTINRAAKVADGGKLYFPSHNSIVRRDEPSTSHNRQVNINTASQSQLEALPGIGPVTATKIINGRPYQTLDELVTKKALSRSLLKKLKDQLSL
jgi:competence protein ComEA